MWLRGLLAASVALVVACTSSGAVGRKPAPSAGRATANEARWYGAEPHTPLAVVDARGVREAGAASCRAFSVLESRWLAVDAFGQVVGSARLVGSEHYDVSGCEEVTFRVISGSAGIGLHVSDSGSWHQPRSSEWTPTVGQRAAVLSAAEQAAGRRTHVAPNAPRGTLFFRLPGSSVEDRLAIVGGPDLVILRANGAGGWSPVHVQKGSSVPRTSSGTFRPLAAFDIDGDGVPEVVVHEDHGDSFEDVLLKVDAGGWHVRARSIYGSTA